jgi:hypothetical protein
VDISTFQETSHQDQVLGGSLLLKMDIYGEIRYTYLYVENHYSRKISVYK